MADLPPSQDHGMPELRALLTERTPGEREQVEAAYRFARDAHGDVLRKSGEPYITHPVAVAVILARLGMDTPSLMAGLLHDTVEDVDWVTFELLAQEFGPEVAKLVEGETKFSKLSKQGSQRAEVEEAGRDIQAENLRQMLMATTGDLRVMVVKLADRLHNMRTLGSMPAHKQRRIARETLEIFAPLAHRLGIGSIKWELEDLSFRYLDPEAYEYLSAQLRTRQEEREAQLEEAVRELQEALDDEHDLTEKLEEINISGRSKHLWSIHSKMQKEGKSLGQIFDLLALRVILTPRPPTFPEGLAPEKRERAEEQREKGLCYQAFSVVHTLWTPLPGRVKDYIAVPKSNGYRSLHTTVISRSGHPIEVQIRSRRMHDVAEYGVAAHWMYKQGDRLARDQREAIVRELSAIGSEINDASDFIDAVKNDLLSQRVLVFTPKGQALSLTAGSTPIDFAYRIHSRVGETATGARANGVIVPLSYRLQNGDMVEILTSKSGKPSEDWLNFVVTRSARAKIRAATRQQQRSEALTRGYDLLDKYLRRRQLPARQLMRLKFLEEASQQLVGSRNPDDMYFALAAGKLSPQTVLRALSPRLAKEQGQSGGIETPARPAPKRRVARPPVPESAVHVEGLTMTKLSNCCQPIRGDQIMGYLTRGRGVSIHRIDCPNMVRLLRDEPERCVPAGWNNGLGGGRLTVNLEVLAADRDHLLSDVMRALSETQTGTLKVDARVNPDRSAQISLRVAVHNNDHLERTRSALLDLTGVSEVARA